MTLHQQHPVSDPRQGQFHAVRRDVYRHGPWWDRLAYIQRKLARELIAGLQRLELAAGCVVLDFGCAEQPYRKYLPAAVRYVGADLPGNLQADVHIGTDGRLPLTDAEFDAVLSTQVLEHVADPEIYLREVFRVLKPGGRLLLSTHGIMVYHPDPVDYWRWTGEGLTKILRDAGFETLEMRGVMGLASTGLQLLQDGVWGSLPKWLRPLVGLLSQTVIAMLDRMTSDQSRRFNALVYVALARKPERCT